MLAKQETRRYAGGARVWAGKYQNSHNVLHWHYACELLYVERGDIEVFCGEESYLLHEGQAFFIDSGEVHYMHAKNQTVLIVMTFENEIVKPVCEMRRLLCPLLCGDYKIPETYARISEELREKRPFYNAAAENEILALAIRIFRGERTAERKMSSGTVQSFKDLLADINERYAFYTFTDAANFMGFSEAYFSKFFKKIAGMTFSQYLNRVKVEEAVRLLRENKGLPVTEIAFRCGFNTIRNFNRIFKKVTGCTPRSRPKTYVPDEKFIYSVSGDFDPTSRETTLLTEH